MPVICIAPIAVHAVIIVYENCGVRTENTGCAGWNFERTVWAVRHCDIVSSAPAGRIRVKIIGFGVIIVDNFGNVWCKHRPCVTVDIGFKNDTVVTPDAQIFHGRRPNDLIQSAPFTIAPIVMGAINVDTVCAGVIRILKNVRLSIGNAFPERQIGVALMAGINGFCRQDGYDHCSAPGGAAVRLHDRIAFRLRSQKPGLRYHDHGFILGHPCHFAQLRTGSRGRGIQLEGIADLQSERLLIEDQRFASGAADIQNVEEWECYSDSFAVSVVPTGE